MHLPARSFWQPRPRGPTIWLRGGSALRLWRAARKISRSELSAGWLAGPGPRPRSAPQRIPAVCCLRARPLGRLGVVCEQVQERRVPVDAVADGLTDDEIAALLVQERRVPVDAVASSACDFFDDPPQCHLIEKAADGRGGRAQPGRRVPYCDDGLLGRRVEQPRGGSERRGCAGRRCPAGQLPPGRGLGWVQPRPRAVAALQSRGPSPAMGAPPVSLRGCVRAGGRADNKVRLSAGCSLAAGLGPRSWWPQPWAAPRLAPHRRWCNYHRLSR